MPGAGQGSASRTAYERAGGGDRHFQFCTQAFARAWNAAGDSRLRECLDAVGQDREIEQAGTQQRVNELEVLDSPGSEFGGSKVVTFEA